MFTIYILCNVQIYINAKTENNQKLIHQARKNFDSKKASLEISISKSKRDFRAPPAADFSQEQVFLH